MDECYACAVGVATGPESHAENCVARNIPMPVQDGQWGPEWDEYDRRVAEARDSPMSDPTARETTADELTEAERELDAAREYLGRIEHGADDTHAKNRYGRALERRNALAAVERSLKMLEGSDLAREVLRLREALDLAPTGDDYCETVEQLDAAQDEILRRNIQNGELTAERDEARARVAELERQHRPDRASDIAAWLKRKRDEKLTRTEAWYVLDDLLGSYRLHADTGTPLASDEPEEGPWPTV